MGVRRPSLGAAEQLAERRAARSCPWPRPSAGGPKRNSDRAARTVRSPTTIVQALRLLEPGRDVDRIAGDQEVVAVAAPGGDDFAGIDAQPDRQPIAKARVGAHAVAQLQRGRRARAASSPWAGGSPNTAMTASPMNFSTVPPWAATTSLAIA